VQTYLNISKAEVVDAHGLDPLVQLYERHRSTSICHHRGAIEKKRTSVSAQWNILRRTWCVQRIYAVDWLAAGAADSLHNYL
jgi:hypothetical protein